MRGVIGPLFRWFLDVERMANLARPPRLAGRGLGGFRAAEVGGVNLAVVTIV
jgi:hypothetical protein